MNNLNKRECLIKLGIILFPLLMPLLLSLKPGLVRIC